MQTFDVLQIYAPCFTWDGFWRRLSMLLLVLVAQLFHLAIHKHFVFKIAPWQ